MKKDWIKQDFIEELANLEHRQWQHWTSYFLRFHHYSNFRKRWKKQLRQDYKDLTEKEKESDRVWAKKVIKLIDDKVKRLETMYKSLDNLAKATLDMVKKRQKKQDKSNKIDRVSKKLAEDYWNYEEGKKETKEKIIEIINNLKNTGWIAKDIIYDHYEGDEEINVCDTDYLIKQIDAKIK